MEVRGRNTTPQKRDNTSIAPCRPCFVLVPEEIRTTSVSIGEEEKLYPGMHRKGILSALYIRKVESRILSNIHTQIGRIIVMPMSHSTLGSSSSRTAHYHGPRDF